MPISTTLVMARWSAGRRLLERQAGHSPRRSRATSTWPTISPAVRLRTSFWVPVWQKLQVRVQPTWLDMHSVPRSSSGM